MTTRSFKWVLFVASFVIAGSVMAQTKKRPVKKKATTSGYSSYGNQTQQNTGSA